MHEAQWPADLQGGGGGGGGAAIDYHDNELDEAGGGPGHVGPLAAGAGAGAGVEAGAEQAAGMGAGAGAGAAQQPAAPAVPAPLGAGGA